MAAWTKVQSTFQRVTSGANAKAYASNNAAGNLLLVVVVFEDDTSTVSSVTDSAGNTWTQCGPIKHSGVSNVSLQMFYAKNCAAGANTVTVTPSAGITWINIYEYSGGDTVAPLDQHIEATGSGTTTANSGSVTTTAAGELLFAGCASNRTLTVGSGYTVRDSDSFNDFYNAEDQTAGAAGSYNATETLGSTGTFVIALATFKAAGSATRAPSMALLGAG